MSNIIGILVIIGTIAAVYYLGGLAELALGLQGVQ